MRASVVNVIGSLAIACLAHAVSARAECVTKPAKIDPELNGKDAYALAKAEAAKWNADSVPTKFATLLGSPLDAQGRSGEWSFQFFSAGAKKLTMIGLAKGAMTCFAIDTASGGRPIAITDKTVLDTKQLLDLAQQAGGAKFDPKTVTVDAQLVQNPSDGPLWYLTYETIAEPKKEVLQVVVNGSGKVVMQ